MQARLLLWLDAHKGSKDLAGQGFADWRPFTHLTLGAVEIGGFTRYFPCNPPPGRYFEEVVTAQAKAAVVQALTTPLVKIRTVTVTRTGNTWEVTASVLNEGFFDTSTEQGAAYQGMGRLLPRQARPVAPRTAP